MDENDKPDGSTAMERLCRELMDAVVSCAPTVWCGEHGIGIHGTRLEQDRENARADISRRIDWARDEDECEDTYSARELKRLTGMYLGGAMTTMGEVAEMVGAVEEWKAKAAELDALRGAGRVVPEGCRWPGFGDGGRLALGGEAWTKDGGRVRVVAVSHRGRAAVRPWGRKDGRGARWVPLSSLLGECPDSWARLREDARKDYTAYWGCIGFCCDKCPALVDGKKPNEHYDTAGCHTAEQIDLLARAERLAGVNGDER